MRERLTKALRPERACEEDVIEAVVTFRNADLIADLIERAIKRAWLHGAETGRREMAEEPTEARCEALT